MARRRKPLLDKKKLLLLGVALLVAVIGVAFLKTGEGRQFSKLAEFPVENYLENNGVISQQDFVIDGTVENVLLREGASRRYLVSIQTGTNGFLLPVIFESDDKPIQRGQRLLMVVHLDADDRIVCTDYETR